jgi:hypothetical protein
MRCKLACMNSPKRIDRKLFLTFTLSSTAAFAIGCSSDPDPVTPAGAGAGGAPSGGAAGAPSAGAGGSVAGAPAAGAPSAGAGGAAAGSSGAAGSASGGASGAAGASAGAGGAPVTANCSTLMKTLITANHGHVFTVSADDVVAGALKVYDTKGAADHPHFLQLTAADFTKLKNGGTVRKVSCNDGHEHEFIVNCVGEAQPKTTSGIANFCDAGHKCGESNTSFCPEVTP